MSIYTLYTSTPAIQCRLTALESDRSRCSRLRPAQVSAQGVRGVATMSATGCLQFARHTLTRIAGRYSSLLVFRCRHGACHMQPSHIVLHIHVRQRCACTRHHSIETCDAAADSQAAAVEARGTQACDGDTTWENDVRTRMQPRRPAAGPAVACRPPWSACEVCRPSSQPDNEPDNEPMLATVWIAACSAAQPDMLPDK